MKKRLTKKMKFSCSLYSQQSVEKTIDNFRDGNQDIEFKFKRIKGYVEIVINYSNSKLVNEEFINEFSNYLLFLNIK